MCRPLFGHDALTGQRLVSADDQAVRPSLDELCGANETDDDDRDAQPRRTAAVDVSALDEAALVGFNRENLGAGRAAVERADAGETVEDLSADNTSSDSELCEMRADQADREVAAEYNARAAAVFKQGGGPALQAFLADESAKPVFAERTRPAKASAADKARYTQDELLYDPHADDDDATWLADQRQGGEATRASAHLSCPCCLTLVCIDCQQHELYATQFRAMFVFNCIVARLELLRFGEQAGASERREVETARGKHTIVGESAAGDETFFPVRCEVCATELGVMETESELVHFFNVVASAEAV